MTENDLVERIRSLFPTRRARVGIGDDAAVVRVERDLVVTTDLLVEGIDFLETIPLELIARKSLAVNLSDLAAMGSKPEWFLLTLGIPSQRLSSISRFLEALADAARDASVELVGGDLSSSDRLLISITLAGVPETSGRLLLRSGAKPGDRIFVSRPLGAPSAGLELLRRGWTVDRDGGVTAPPALEGSTGYDLREIAASVIHRHVTPEAEVALGLALAGMDSVTSCIDVSDGLSTDLHRLCRASACGAMIDWERLPIFPDLERLGRRLGIDADAAALHGGEEFALLFTASATESDLSRRTGRPVYAIGRVIAEQEVRIRREGRETGLTAAGFDHFENAHDGA